MGGPKLKPLDPVVHAQLRLAVLSVLVGVRSAEFTFLRETTGATDGNLSTHLAKLEEAGYVSVRKAFRGRKPVTSYAITAKGRQAFERYVEALRDYLPRGN